MRIFIITIYYFTTLYYNGFAKFTTNLVQYLNFSISFSARLIRVVKMDNLIRSNSIKYRLVT